MGAAPSAPRFPLHGLALRDPSSSAACQTSHLIPVRRTCVGLSGRVWLLELGVLGRQAMGLSARVGGHVKELLGPVGVNAQTEGVVLLAPGEGGVGGSEVPTTRAPRCRASGASTGDTVKLRPGLCQGDMTPAGARVQQSPVRGARNLL